MAKDLGENMDQHRSATGSSSQGGTVGGSTSADVLTMLTAEREPTRVSYSFHTKGDPDATWHVSSVRMREELSQQYEVAAELVSAEGDDASKLLGQPCTLALECDDARRFVHGIVSWVERGDKADHASVVRVRIVPALQALAQRTDCRIFQDKTVPEVLDQVLGAALPPYGRKHEPRLWRSVYPKREYIVQYRESDLAFVERLMAEEGIWYCFEHAPKEGEAELLVLLDDNRAAKKANLGQDGDELPLQREHAGITYERAATRFVSNEELVPTSLTAWSFNWTNPLRPQHKAVPGEDPGERPQYEPDDATLWGYDGAIFKSSDVEDQAKVRWERVQGRALRAYGQGNVIGLCPGQRIAVKDHSPEIDGNWLVVRVSARGRDARRLDRAVEHLEDYSNEFICIRSTLPFRPERRPRARVHGIETALVVGVDAKPEVGIGGDDIHTDEHGRVRVKLSWDRSEAGQPGATSTCSLRVAQAWAGNGFGFMFVPRIGAEVVVSFIGGDPDRPLVTGCVYNGLNRPPYEQPAEKSKSYIKTQSSPHGEGSNELCFDDASGKERIYVHAQRDFDTVVEHDESTQVRANQTTKVEGDQSLSVAGKRTTKIGGANEKGEENTIHGDRHSTITKNEVLETGEIQKHTLGKGREVTVSQGDDNCTVADGHKTTQVAKKYTQKSGDQFAIAQGSDEGTKLVLNDSVFVETQGELTFHNERGKIYASSNGKLLLQASDEIQLVCGLASLALKKDGSVEIKGIKVTVGTSTSTLMCDARGATLNGPMATVMGQTMTAVKGAMIAIGS